MNVSRALAIAAMGFASIALGACAKKFEAPTGAAKMELAVKDRAPNSTLAYEHEVGIEAERELIAQRVEATRAACAAAKQAGCTILEVIVRDREAYDAGRIRMRLAPSGIEALVKTASEGATVASSETRAEDLGQPLADVSRQLKMLSDYRDRLSTMMARKDLAVADLINVSKELANTQTQIEALSSENAQLQRRIDTDLLTITWRLTRSDARSVHTPIRDAVASFGDNFGEAIGDVIEFLAILVPWLIIGLPSLVLLRMFWRWTGNWLSRKVRAQPAA